MKAEGSLAGCLEVGVGVGGADGETTTIPHTVHHHILSVKEADP